MLHAGSQLPDGGVLIDVDVVGPRAVGEHDPQVGRTGGLVARNAHAGVEIPEERGVGEREGPAGEAADINAHRELEAGNGLDTHLARRGNRGEVADLRVELEVLFVRLQRPRKVEREREHAVVFVVGIGRVFREQAAEAVHESVERRGRVLVFCRLEDACDVVVPDLIEPDGVADVRPLDERQGVVEEAALLDRPQELAHAGEGPGNVGAVERHQPPHATEAGDDHDGRPVVEDVRVADRDRAADLRAEHLRLQRRRQGRGAVAGANREAGEPRGAEDRQGGFPERGINLEVFQFELRLGRRDSGDQATGDCDVWKGLRKGGANLYAALHRDIVHRGDTRHLRAIGRLDELDKETAVVTRLRQVDAKPHRDDRHRGQRGRHRPGDCDAAGRQAVAEVEVDGLLSGLLEGDLEDVGPTVGRRIDLGGNDVDGGRRAWPAVCREGRLDAALARRGRLEQIAGKGLEEILAEAEVAVDQAHQPRQAVHVGDVHEWQRRREFSHLHEVERAHRGPEALGHLLSLVFREHVESIERLEVVLRKRHRDGRVVEAGVGEIPFPVGNRARRDRAAEPKERRICEHRPDTVDHQRPAGFSRVRAPLLAVGAGSMAVVGHDRLAVDRLAVPEIEPLLKLRDRQHVIPLGVGGTRFGGHSAGSHTRLPFAHLDPGLRLLRVRDAGRRHRHLEPQASLESSRDGIAIARDRAVVRPPEVGVAHRVGRAVGQPAVGTRRGGEPGAAGLGKGLLAALDPIREEQVAREAIIALGVFVGELPVAAELRHHAVHEAVCLTDGKRPLATWSRRILDLDPGRLVDAEGRPGVGMTDRGKVDRNDVTGEAGHAREADILDLDRALGKEVVGAGPFDAECQLHGVERAAVVGPRRQPSGEGLVVDGVEGEAVDLPAIERDHEHVVEASCLTLDGVVDELRGQRHRNVLALRRRIGREREGIAPEGHAPWTGLPRRRRLVGGGLVEESDIVDQCFGIDRATARPLDREGERRGAVGKRHRQQPAAFRRVGLVELDAAVDDRAVGLVSPQHVVAEPDDQIVARVRSGAFERERERGRSLRHVERVVDAGWRL